MAITDYYVEIELGGSPPISSSVGHNVNLELAELLPPGGAFDEFVVNKAWHAPTAQWIRWLTIEPDNGGQQYPGPGVFGDCTDFRLEVVTYQPVE